jgi:hypothetical protein
MNEDDFQEFIKKYPLLMRKISYLEVGKGWKDLLSRLFFLLERHVFEMPIHLQNDVYLEQVKEKFGTLRIYCSHETPFIQGAVAMAESISATICEDCGMPGIRRQESWIKTRCDVCHDNWKNRKI